MHELYREFLKNNRPAWGEKTHQNWVAMFDPPDAEYKSLLRFPEDPRKLDADYVRALGEKKSPRTKKPLSPNTIRQFITYARQFLQWVHDEKGEEWAREQRDTMNRRRLKKPKVTRRHKVTRDDLYTPDEVRKMFSAIGDSDRDLALVHLLYESAMRREEVMSMCCEDLEFRQDQESRIVINIKVRQSKTDAGYRTITVAKCAKALRDWMNKRELMGLPAEGPLWVSIKAPYEPLETATLHRIIGRILKNAGLRKDKKRIIHMFRHTAITNLVRQGLRGARLWAYVGWREGTMEKVYVHLAEEDAGNGYLEAIGYARREGEIADPIPAQKCSACGEFSKPTAKLCEHCGLSFDDTIRSYQYSQRAREQENMIADLKSKYAELLVEHNQNAHQNNRLLILSQELAEEHKELQEAHKKLGEQVAEFPEVKELLAQVNIFGHLVDMPDEEALKVLHDIREATKTMPKAKSKKKGKSGGSKK